MIANCDHRSGLHHAGPYVETLDRSFCLEMLAHAVLVMMLLVANKNEAIAAATLDPMAIPTEFLHQRTRGPAMVVFYAQATLALHHDPAGITPRANPRS